MEKTHPDYVYSTKIALRHTDAAGIVFFPRYLELMHDAYEAFLDSRGLSPARILTETHYFMPVVRTECEYRAPLQWGDAIHIELTVAEIRRRSFTVAYRFTADHKTLAKGLTADKQTQKSIPLPEELQHALKGRA